MPSPYLFIAGPYTATWNGAALGITLDGFDIEQSWEAENIIGDVHGDTVLDGVYRGGQCFINFVLEEAQRASVIDLFNPFGTNPGDEGLVGKLLSNYAKALVLTAVAGTTAATAPATLTASLAIIAPNAPVVRGFKSRLRKVPVRMRILPVIDEQTGAATWYTVT